MADDVDIKALIKEELTSDSIQMMSGNIDLRKEKAMLSNAIDIFYQLSDIGFDNSDILEYITLQIRSAIGEQY